MPKKSPQTVKHWFSPRMKWRTFKTVMDLFPKGCIVPQNIDKILWQMLRDRKINVGIDPSEKEDPIFITVKQIPKNALIITTPLTHTP